MFSPEYRGSMDPAFAGVRGSMEPASFPDIEVQAQAQIQLHVCQPGYPGTSFMRSEDPRTLLFEVFQSFSIFTQSL